MRVNLNRRTRGNALFICWRTSSNAVGNKERGDVCHALKARSDVVFKQKRPKTDVN